MHLGWSTEQLNIRSRYKKIGEKLGARESFASQSFDAEGWQLLREEGLWRIIIAPAYGGEGRTWWDFTAALEGLASQIRRPELLLSIVAQAGMVRALSLYGSEQQCQKYLPKLLDGVVSATAIAEPSTGTDVRAITTQLQINGDRYILNGSKFNIAHAPIADFFLVVSKCIAPGSEGTTLLLLDRQSFGITYGAPQIKLGNKGLPTGSIDFSNVRVDRDQILGTPGNGLRDLVSIISLGRMYYGLIAANVMLPFMDDAIEFTKKRSSFGEKINAHQYVQGRLVNMKIGMERSKWTAYGALHQLLNDEPEAIMSCSIAKILGSNDLLANATSLVQLFGSLGYHEGAISDFLKDAVGFSSIGGTEEMHKKISLIKSPGSTPTSKAGSKELLMKRKFIQKIVVKYRDTDSMGHVSSPVYYEYIQDAYVKYMHELLEIPFDKKIPQIMLKTSCDYVRPAQLGDTLNISARVSRFGTKSFDIEYEIFRMDTEPTLIARGSSTHVAFDYQNNRTIPIPSKLIQQVAAFQTDTPTSPT